MRFATIAPTHAPTTCATTYTPASRVGMPPRIRSASVTTGLKCAPDTDPNARINATSPAPVAIEFSSSCSPTSSGDRRCAAIPEPTTIATRNAVPTASAVARRARSASCMSPERRQAQPQQRAADSGALPQHIASLGVGCRIDRPQLAGGISTSASTV